MLVFNSRVKPVLQLLYSFAHFSSHAEVPPFNLSSFWNVPYITRSDKVKTGSQAFSATAGPSEVHLLSNKKDLIGRLGTPDQR